MTINQFKKKKKKKKKEQKDQDSSTFTCVALEIKVCVHFYRLFYILWTDCGELAVEVHDPWECLEHGIHGGLCMSQLVINYDVEIM